MEACEIIEYLRDQGLTVKADGDYLELSPVEKITEELIQRLKKYKPVILTELKREESQKKQRIEIIRSWLYRFGEPEEDHCLVLDKCKRDPEALVYFLKLAVQ